MFYRLGLIEAYGAGVARMFEAYEDRAAAPVFDIRFAPRSTRMPMTVLLFISNGSQCVTMAAFGLKESRMKFITASIPPYRLRKA